MDIAQCRYIVVEGPIGAGKTSLARQLADHLDADMLLEQPEDNPFLPRFYDDMARFALPTQLTFLFQRVDQLRGLTQVDMFREPTVSDFLLDKDPLFARLNLSDDEYALYDKVYRHLKPQTPVPDLVIYLQAPVDTLLSRVRMRGVSFEQSIPDEYLARLADAYSRYFYQYDEAPLLIINSERLNFVDNPSHLRMLLARIGSMRARREFFNLGQA
ncbi:MAG: deoxynucleoside kinase [Burkholderiales bacterium]